MRTPMLDGMWLLGSVCGGFAGVYWRHLQNIRFFAAVACSVDPERGE